MKKKVLIVDDHPLFREGLRNLVERTRGYVCVGEAGTGRDAVRMARDLRPDLATVDVSIGDMTGMDVAREILAIHPAISILMVSMHSQSETVLEAFRAGAKGYVIKDASASKLIQALDSISKGDCYLDGSISQEIIFKLVRGEEQEQEESRYGTLSLREQQIMRLVVEGHPTREIASQLALQPKTVENHTMNLMRKLKVRNRVELVRYAAEIGLIEVGTARR